MYLDWAILQYSFRRQEMIDKIKENWEQIRGDQPVRFGTLYVSAYAERHSGKLHGYQEGREQPDRLR